MKVTREKLPFAPVTIVIETQKELDQLDDQLDIATDAAEVIVDSALFTLWAGIRDVK